MHKTCEEFDLGADCCKYCHAAGVALIDVTEYHDGVNALVCCKVLVALDEKKPCKGVNANVCVAEGCYGASCIKESI